MSSLIVQWIQLGILLNIRLFTVWVQSSPRLAPTSSCSSKLCFRLMSLHMHSWLIIISQISSLLWHLNCLGFLVVSSVIILIHMSLSFLILHLPIALSLLIKLLWNLNGLRLLVGSWPLPELWPLTWSWAMTGFRSLVGSWLMTELWPLTRSWAVTGFRPLDRPWSWVIKLLTRPLRSFT